MKDSAEQSNPSNGSVSEPAAWVAFATDASESRAVCLTRQEAETVSRQHRWGVAPLYAVRLTDAEREALERLCEATSDMIDDDKRADGCHWQDDAAAVAVVRGLMERLK